ncbi:MAG: tryptophan 7-halogenase [Rubrivivax sp.]|nr:tryptophan 7-halogenase [Rubrivivax sp.]
MSTGFDCDVFVAGGGPAGATVATLLARQGRRVVMVEKDRHPRFHIGESLLPANVRLFEELGVRAEVERIGMPKWGVEFVSPQHEQASLLEFAEAWDKSMPMAWQVRRSELDLILFRHAAASGAQCHEGMRVRSAAFDAEGVSITAIDADGAERRWRARYLVDASGRDTLLANQLGIKRKHPQHNSAALFGHFRGARRLEGRLEGNISVFWFAHGWFWFIPLADGTTSVGAACWPYYLKQRDRPLKQYFLDTIALAPRLAERLAGAELVDDAVYATGNYSYTSDRCAGPRYQMVGDAYAFIDPVFSSGVYLAMASAFVGADLAAATLDRGPAAAAAERRRFEAHMKKGPREFSWFIFRMTNPAIRELFMSPRNVLRAKEAVLAVLAGDIFGRTPFRGSLRFFKAVYYFSSLLTPRRTWNAWRRRSASIRDTGEVKGENVMAGAR